MILSKPFVLVATLALATSVAPRMLFAQATQKSVALPDEERRRTLYQDGKAAIKAQRWVSAKTALEQAWAISPSYDVALLLSQAEMNLDHYPEGARLLAYYFRNVSAKEAEKTYNNAKQAFEHAKQKVSAVTVTAPAGAEIWVDGKSVGTAPLDGAVFVGPGKRTFEARRGDVKGTQALDAVAGQEQAVALSFPEAPPPSIAPSSRPEASVSAGLPEPAPQATQELPSGRRDAGEPSLVEPDLTPVLIGGGLALAGAAFGTGFSIAASSSRDDLDELKRKNGDEGCSNGTATQADCTAQQNTASRLDSQRNVATISFVVAGAALVGTAVYWFWPRSSRQSAATHSRLFLAAAPSPQGASISLSGSF